MGIRPEAFATTPRGASVELKTHVEAVEFLGHETLACLVLSGAAPLHTDQHFIARLPGQFHKPGDNVRVFYIEPEALYFFNQAGRNILIEGIGNQ